MFDRKAVVEVQIPAHMEYLVELRNLVEKAGRKHGLPNCTISAIRLALDEAVTNIIHHAYEGGEGQIRLKVFIKSDRMTLCLLDQGRHFDPNLFADIDLHRYVEERRRGGLGIALMRRLVDRLEYRKTKHGNELRLVKYATQTRKSRRSGFLASGLVVLFVGLPVWLPPRTAQGHVNPHRPAIEVQTQDAMAHYNRGVTLYNSGAFDAALQAFQQALVLYRQSGAVEQIVNCLKAIGDVHRLLGRHDRAITSFRSALDYFGDAGLRNPLLEADLHRLLGWTCYASDAQQQAVQYFESALERYRNIVDASGEANSLYGLGLAYLELEDFREARETLARAETLFDRLNDADNSTYCRYYVARCDFQLGHYEGAAQSFRSVLSEAQERSLSANSAYWLGLALYELEDYVAASEPLKTAAAHFEVLAEHHARAYAVTKLGECHFAREDWPAAIAAYRQAVALFESLNAPDDLLMALRSLGSAYYNNQEFLQAIAHYRRAARVARNANLIQDQAEALELLGSAYELADSLESAAQTFGQAAEIFRALQRPDRAVRLYLQQGEGYVTLEQLDQAERAFREASSLAGNSFDLLPETARAQKGLADVQRLSGNLEGALRSYQVAWERYGQLPEPQPARVAECLEAMAETYFELDRFPEAGFRFEQAASTYAELGDAVTAARCRYNAGLSFYYADNLHEARQHYEAAGRLYARLRDRLGQAKVESGIADLFLDQELSGQAIAHYETALRLFAEEDDLPGLAETHLGLAKAHANAEPADLHAAERHYQEAVRRYSEIADLARIAECQRGLAEVAFARNEYESARARYDEARRRYVALGQWADAALCLENLGNCSYNLKAYDQALQAYREAAEIYLRIPDLLAEARCRLHMGDAQITWHRTAPQPGLLGEAGRHYERALHYYRQVNDHGGLFDALVGMGTVYFYQRQYGEARVRYERALEHRRFVSPKRQFEALHRLAQVYLNLQDTEKTLAILDQLLRMEEVNLDDRLQVLIETADLYRKLNLYEQALKLYDRAVEMARRAGSEEYLRAAQIEKANLLYLDIGARKEAEAIYQQTLTLAEAANHAGHISACLTGLANILHDEGRYADGLTFLERVMNLQSDDSVSVATTYLNIGNIHKSLGSLEKARRYYSDARRIAERLEIYETLATSFNNLGVLDLNRGLYQQALEKFESAGHAAERAFLKRLLITIYANRGVVFENMGRFREARDAYEKAIDLVESIRQELREEKLVLSFIDNTSELYEHMITLLFERLDEPEAALSFIERSRSEGLVESYRKRMLAVGNSTLVARLDSLQIAIKELNENQTRLQKELAKPGYARDSALVENLSRVVAVNAQQVTRLERELRQRYPEYPGMVEVRAAQVAGIRNIIPRGASLVMYYPSEAKLYIFVARSDRFFARAVDIPRKQLYTLIRRYRELVSEDMARLREARTAEQFENILRIDTWDADWIRPLADVSTELHKYLIRPFQAELGAGDTVIFIPSGLLHYLPLHALAEPAGDGALKFVIERWTVAYFTSTTFMNSIMRSTIQAISREQCAEAVLAVGNSTGELRGVNAEMGSLRQFAPSADVVLGLDATEEIVKQRAAESCFLVVSDHCYVNTQRTDETFIQLAATAPEDGRWHTAEIETAHFPAMDLVVLPNCQTAVGEANPVAGVRNLVHSFSVAGAISIVATLWPVSDYFTPTFMHEFYRNYFDQRRDKAQAMRYAQLKLLERPETRHPFYWAGFMLYGYWYQDTQAFTGK